MGRVRKYKKLKAVDPASKRLSSVVDTTRDEPPELHTERVKKSLQKLNSQWMDDDKRERQLQKEALRVLRQEEAEKRNGRVKKVEGKREDENMKEFKERVRQETRATLAAEMNKMTKTAKKKKAFLAAKKLEKKTGVKRQKGAAQGADDEEEEGFSHRGDGYLRASDRGGGDTFRTEDHVNFGERVERPPEISFGLTDKQKAKIASKKKKNELLLLNKMTYAPGAKNGRSSSATQSSRAAAATDMEGKSKLSDRDITLARDEAREAYKKLRLKRRDEGR